MTKIIQLKIVLDETKPEIWRRIQVESNITFMELHHAIQIAMGWENCHLFEFKVNSYRISYDSEKLFEDDDAVIDANSVILESVLTESKEKFIYEYDFGDYWVHKITVEKLLPKDNSIKYPICIGGALACPHEDSGGVYGYYEKLEIIKNPEHPEYKEIRKWLGAKFNPEYFDIEKTNKGLSKIKSYINSWKIN